LPLPVDPETFRESALGYRVSRNSRLTVEDVIQHIPQTKNTLNMQYTVGY